MLNSIFRRSATPPGRFRIALTQLALVLALGVPTLTLGQSASFPFPQFNSSYVAGTEIPIQVTVTPAGKTVSKVTFSYQENFSGNYITLGDDTSTPYSYDWITPTPTQLARSYQIRAIVTFTDNSTVTANAGTGYVGITVYRPEYVSTRNWYVSASASASNTAGTLALPFNTIQKAADRVAPGDTVFVMAGNYTGTGVNIVQIQRTGFSNRWIVVMPYQTDKPKLVMGNNNWNAINVLPAAAYVKVQGFEVVGNNANITLTDAKAQPGACEGASPAATPIPKFNGNGISISGRGGGNLRPHHVVFANNVVHDCAGAGLSAIESDYVTIEGNTSYNNSWYTVYGTSGISVFNSWNYDNTTGTKMTIRNNVCYGNILKIAWNIGGTGTNCKFYDGNGIILDNNDGDKNPLGAFTGSFLVENNLCYLNGGRGLNVNYTDNATLRNNTTYRNGVSDGGPGVGIESEFIAQGSGNVRVYNNIFSGRPGEKTIEVNNSVIEHNHNLTFEGTGNPYFTGNQNITGQDPQFVDAANGDFKLLQTSPAVNKGSSTAGQYATADLLGIARPQGTGVDIGAYELQGTPISFSQQPVGGDTVCVGGTATASVLVEGPGPITYQWLKNGNPLEGNASASTATLTLTNVSAADAGSYTVIVTAFNQLTSSAFVLTINPLPTPGISAGGPTTFCAGGSVVLSAGSFNGYVWKTGETQVGTEATFTATNSTSYTVTVTDANGCTATSGPVTVTVNALPTVSITGLAASYCQSASPVTLTGSATPSGGTGSFTVDTNPATQFNPVSPGTHTVVFSYTDPNGCQNAASQSVEVTPLTITQAATVTGAPLCAGQVVTLLFDVSCAANARFTAELSDAAGNFPGYTFPGTVTPGSPNLLLIPTTIGTGTGYKIRVVGLNPSLSTTSTAFTINALGQVSVALYPATPGKLCQGETLPVTFSTTGACPFPADNVFTVQLSSATGSFASPTVLGTATPGTTSFPLPGNLPLGNGYRVRILSSNPTQTSSASAPFKLEGPSLTATPGIGQVPVCRGSQLTVSYILPASCPFPEGNLFTAQLSNASGSFASPLDLGTITPGQQTALTIPANAAPGTGYRIRIVSSNPVLTSPGSIPFRVNACVSRQSVEDARVVVMPNPVVGGEIRCRVSGMDNPEFGLVNATGRSRGLTAKSGGVPGEYTLSPQQTLTPGVYLLHVTEGTLRLTHRVLVVD